MRLERLGNLKYPVVSGIEAAALTIYTACCPISDKSSFVLSASMLFSVKYKVS
jgi:hypothetical protein